MGCGIRASGSYGAQITALCAQWCTQHSQAESPGSPEASAAASELWGSLHCHKPEQERKTAFPVPPHLALSLLIATWLLNCAAPMLCEQWDVQIGNALCAVVAASL